MLGALHREFDGRRRDLLALCVERAAKRATGEVFDFLPETRAIREDTTWRVAASAPGLVDRRVEITGPTDKKMTVNALNSGAKVWLADHEAANTPLWENVIEGQLNLRDAHRPNNRFHQFRRQAVHAAARRRACNHRGPSAWLASARKTYPRGRRRNVRDDRGLRALPGKD